ncbi:hypothetical protein B0H19DRAFT_1095831 [Mycena capillaripes]|nr:hypothetical protein B0H19DRAFT_1095831 [Mycena capillaripes]
MINEQEKSHRYVVQDEVCEETVTLRSCNETWRWQRTNRPQATTVAVHPARTTCNSVE